jgi:hypothetical protein
MSETQSECGVLIHSSVDIQVITYRFQGKYKFLVGDFY